MEESQVDISLVVIWEPGIEGPRLESFAAAVDDAEEGDGPREKDEICERSEYC